MIQRRAVILPVMLLILVLLGLLVAMFSFRVNADLAATQAMIYRQQTRLAAEAGIDRVRLLLQTGRFDMDKWYNNPDELHRIIVWMHDGDESIWGTNDEFDDVDMSYRFSIVADEPSDDEDLVRFGITDEASKLNLNVATREQLLVLVTAAMGADEQTTPEQIVGAILDWRDADHNPIGPDVDTEGVYYAQLVRPYRVKNGPFDTVEELLFVKGVTPQLLYGEDYDRNGLLTRNEDDGNETFPADNEDNVLNRGLYPYLTVHSSDNNVSNANRPRVYLLGEGEQVRAELAAVFPDDPLVVDFIIAAARGNSAGNAAPSGGGSGSGGSSPENAGGAENQAAGDGEGDAANVDGSSENADSGGAELNGGGAQATPIATPAGLLRSGDVDGGSSILINPLTVDHLPLLMDRTTTVPPDRRTLPGLININTAPRIVLRTLAGLSLDQVDAIVSTRGDLSSEEKETTAWLVTVGVLELETYEAIAPFITARGQQFTIESLGYASHVGMVTRLQVIVDMAGPIVETVYYRDITYLGGHYPIREEDLERVVVR